MGNDTAGRTGRRIAVVLLVIYALAVVFIAFWPVPVDSGAIGLLDRLERRFPWATYGRVEFAANVVFFLPLGWLLSVVLQRARHLVLPIGMLTTITIEAVQGELLAQRTASVADVLANTAGTCLGIVLAAIFSRRERARDADEGGGRAAASVNDVVPPR